VCDAQTARRGLAAARSGEGLLASRLQ